MTLPGHNPHLFKWRRFSKTKTYGDKLRVENGDINQWRERVEMASEFAVSEVFSRKKPHLGSKSRIVPLQSSDQLRDHDDACSEARALLRGWLGGKLDLETETEEEDEPRRSPVANAQPAPLKYNNFDDMYKCLDEEEEQSAVKSFLQDLMERKVLGDGAMDELALDAGQTRRKFRDPMLTMEERHLQVKENRERREAERQRQQRERGAQRVAREEAKRRVREEETRKEQEARRQEEMVQQEVTRLRRQKEGRVREQLPRQREKAGGQRAPARLPSTPFLSKKQQQQADKEQKIQTMVHMRNLKCVQRHFSGWFSVVLGLRLRMGKARALYDWKRQLRAWRGWRAVVWAEREQREVARAEQELREENRLTQQAVESDRRRLLQRCLNEWRRWSRVEKEQRELLAQQQETRRKMAALISAASRGKLKAKEPHQPVMAPPEAPRQPETAEKEEQQRSHNNMTCVGAAGAAARPTQPRKVTQRHAEPTARQRAEGCAKAAALENRHAVHRQIITQQRKQLREQQDEITRLREEQSMMGSELEKEKTAELAQLSVMAVSRPKSRGLDPSELRAPRVTGEPECLPAPQRKVVTQKAGTHPIITAMEARARQREERRREIEELKRKKEEEKLAEMKAAEEQRQRESEEEKRAAAEKNKEEKRQEREREEEKQKQLRRHQELLRLARQHYHRNLLLRRGLAPWKCLIRLREANVQLAESHRNLFLLRRCTLGWQQSARQSLTEREASADQLHQHFLLRRSLSCWTRLKDWRAIQEERAERLYRARTLRRFLSALADHVTNQRLMEWHRLDLAQEHDDRRTLRRSFEAWRRLPSLLRAEREKELRRVRLVRIVAEVLPDFCRRQVAE